MSKKEESISKTQEAAPSDESFSAVSTIDPVLSLETISEKTTTTVSDSQQPVIVESEQLEDEIANQIFSGSGLKNENERENTIV